MDKRQRTQGFLTFITGLSTTAYLGCAALVSPSLAQFTFWHPGGLLFVSAVATVGIGLYRWTTSYEEPCTRCLRFEETLEKVKVELQRANETVLLLESKKEK